MLVGLLILLAPGYAWICVSGLSDEFSFIEKTALAFLLSLCFMSLLTAGLSLLTGGYLWLSVALLAGFSVAALVFALVTRRWSIVSALRLNLNRNSVPLIITTGVLALILLLLSWSSPFYPTADASDPIFHVKMTETIITSGTRTILLRAEFAPGLHFAAAIMAKVLSVGPLESLRILVSLLVLVGPALTYFAARELLGNERIANITVLLAAFAVPVDAIHLIRVGTFPNILGDIIAIATLWLVFLDARKPRFGLVLTLILLGLSGVIAHSSFLLFLGALWVSVPLVFLISRGIFRNYMKALLASTVGPTLFVIALSARDLGRLSGYVDFSPLALTFQQTIQNFFTFVGPINTLSIAVAVVFVVMKRRNVVGSMFVCVWLLLLIAASFFSSSAWRFVLFSLLPASFLVGGAIGFILGYDSVAERIVSARRLNSQRLILASILAVLILSGGFLGILSKVYDPVMRYRQEGVFDSMQWLKQNDAGYAVASVGLLSDYRYLPVLTGIVYVGDFSGSPTQIMSFSIAKNFSYVIVSTQSPFLETFKSVDGFQVEYRNGIAVIFFIMH